MVGITSIKTYIPVYRISGDEIARMWGGRSLGVEKAVAGYDEDSITMAVGAGLDSMTVCTGKMGGLFFATTTAPYKEKQAAAIIASALDLDRSCYTSDFTNSLRAGSLALKSAIDAVQCGSADNIIVIASDCRLGAAQSTFEQTLGDGAASIIIGAQDVIATIEGNYSIFNEFLDTWRTEDDVFERGSEERFIDTVGYKPVLTEVISGLMDKYKVTSKDFSRIVFYAPDARSHAGLAKSLGFDKGQVQDSLYTKVGNTGMASAFIMLAAALDTAEPGDRILFVTYGDGADAFILQVTDNISKVLNKPIVKRKLERKTPITYARYATWRGLVKIEASRLPERPPLSVQCLSREKRNILSLYGVKCKSCGTPQYPASRVCVMCHTKDNFEDYKFSHRKGKLFTYSVDHLQPTLNPPGMNGVVDFDGGGRLVCELTDCDPAKTETGMPVEMTFRKLYQSKGINSYFWKAKPVTED
jgi:hydroxymethylglutaryl-CoA synthase